ncbi:MAG: heme A synthase [Gammaproteobacteria bacterium]|nr:heme A synthase [Gammaproteobacteria bacterium]
MEETQPTEPVNSQHSPPPLKLLVCVSICVAFVVVVLGAYTRLVDAGLGCPDWPGCYGQLVVPSTAEEIAAAEALFPETPVDQAKAWTEMVHRYFATGLGILVIGIVVLAWYYKASLRFPLVLLALVILQGAFGAWTVTLKLWPQVVVAHLLGGFATLLLLWWYMLTLRSFKIPQIATKFRAQMYVFSALLVVQISFGGWVSANYAALICPDFPLCHGTLLPEMDFVAGLNIFQTIGPDYTGGEMSHEGRVAIQNLHRWGAYVVFVFGLILAWRIREMPGMVLGLVVCAQVALGISNVLFVLPLPIAVLHNAGAAILLLVAVTLALQSRPKHVTDAQS